MHRVKVARIESLHLVAENRSEENIEDLKSNGDVVFFISLVHYLLSSSGKKPHIPTLALLSKHCNQSMHHFFGVCHLAQSFQITL